MALDCNGDKHRSVAVSQKSTKGTSDGRFAATSPAESKAFAAPRLVLESLRLRAERRAARLTSVKNNHLQRENQPQRSCMFVFKWNQSGSPVICWGDKAAAGLQSMPPVPCQGAVIQIKGLSLLHSIDQMNRIYGQFWGFQGILGTDWYTFGDDEFWKMDGN